MLIPHKGHTDTIQVYSVTVMTHVKALLAGHSSQGTSDMFDPRGLKESLIGQFSLKNELWPTFPKMILGRPGVVLQSLRPIGYSVK